METIKMKNKIWWGIWFVAVCMDFTVVVCGFARADLSAEINVYTNSSVSTSTFLHTDGNGSIYYNQNDHTYYNGNKIDFDSLSVEDNAVARWFSSAIDYVYSGVGSKREAYVGVIFDLMKIFVTKPELRQTNSNTLALLHRLEAVERTLEKVYPEEYCESKLSVLADYGMESTKCGNVTYHLMSSNLELTDQIIGVKAVN